MTDARRTLVLFPDAHGIARGKLLNRGLDEMQRVGFSSGVFSKDVYGSFCDNDQTVDWVVKRLGQIFFNIVTF